MTAGERRNLATGLLFVSPWVIGFLAFGLYPFASSIYYSLCDYSALTPPAFVGLRNYRDLMLDAIFWKALSNTLFFAGVSIPLGMLVSLSLAILLNADIPCRGLFRAIFFVPSLVPMVSLGVLWQWLLNSDVGLINEALRPLVATVNQLLHTHLSTPNWLLDPHWAKWGVIFASLWGVGNTVVIYLAGLQDVPRHLYEAAQIDGAGFWSRIRHITLPMISPVMYFNAIMALIGAFQVFAVPFVMTGGGDGPERSLLFLTTYLYRSAFDYWNMGYACAIGMVLFAVIFSLTFLARRLLVGKVFYAGES